jgi:hypothetical protein
MRGGGDFTNIQIMDGYNKLDQYKKANFLEKMGGMYSGGSADILKQGISMDADAKTKAITLLTEYKVLSS